MLLYLYRHSRVQRTVMKQVWWQKFNFHGQNSTEHSVILNADYFLWHETTLNLRTCLKVDIFSGKNFKTKISRTLSDLPAIISRRASSDRLLTTQLSEAALWRNEKATPLSINSQLRYNGAWQSPGRPLLGSPVHQSRYLGTGISLSLKKTLQWKDLPQ